MRRLLVNQSRWRWGVALGAILVLIALGQLTLQASTAPRQLGATAVRRAGEVLVDRVQPAGWAWDAGIRPGDVVVAIDGRPLDAATLSFSVSNAAAIEVRSKAGNSLSAPAGLIVPRNPVQRAGFAGLAAGLAAVGVVVFVLSTELAVSGPLLMLSLAASVLIVAGLAEESGQAWAFITVGVATLCFGASTSLLFLNFPNRRLSARWARAATLAIVLFHGAILGTYTWVWVVDNEAYEWLRVAAFIVVGADLLGAIALLVTAVVRKRSVDESGRRSLRLLLPGAIAAFAPFALLSLIPEAMGFGYIVTPDITFLTLIFFPASVGAAVLSKSWPGVDRLMRRGLVALGIWVAMLTVYALLTYGFGESSGLEQFEGFEMAGVLVLILLIAATFWPLQRLLRNRLERALFHDVYNYPETLREMSRELSELSQGRSIASYALGRLGTILDLSWAAVLSFRLSGSALYVWRSTQPELREQNAATEEAASELAELEATAAAAVGLASEGESVGRLLVGPKRHDVELSGEDRNLVVTLGPMLSTAFLNARLIRQREQRMRELAARQQELAALSLRLMHTQEEERTRLALDLHDDPLQRAWMLARELGTANGTGDTPRWRRAAEDIAESLSALAVGLRPPALSDLGLIPALQTMLDDANAASEVNASLEVRTTGQQPFGRLDPDLELALYRVTQEALHNCLKHAEAQEVRVIVNRSERSIRLRVTDNGIGFDQISAADAPSPHLGIVGMRERLRPWGGSLTVTRERSGGTTVLARVPLASSGPQGAHPQTPDEGDLIRHEKFPPPWRGRVREGGGRRNA